jgi:uncharacterized protein (DUF433 family)
MALTDRVVVDPKILAGKPVVRGTRISVELVVELLAAGWNHTQNPQELSATLRGGHPGLPRLRDRTIA